ncbi:hypothetical protein O3P69_006435 [Scylla paramamosain]|uniref:Uncharacterized protein n=1 Tax=Scylla paramamosain TaxID=85552 RepID=A0AAW0U2G9_SCYPA
MAKHLRSVNTGKAPVSDNIFPFLLKHCAEELARPLTHQHLDRSNVRGFHTNIGELTHSVIIKNNVDLVFVCETFLDSKVPDKYARVKGYSAWVRKDRSTQGGGVAFCYKETVSAQVVEPPTPVPGELELLALKITGSNGKDHVAVLTRIQFRTPREKSFTRTLWRWEAADWDALRAALKTTDWGDVLYGDANQQVRRLTQLLHALQGRWVPHSDHKTKASDQPWFGPACRSASDAKHRAWRALRRHPTARNREFSFRQGRSAADLHLLLTTDLSAILDQGKATAVVALDIDTSSPAPGLTRTISRCPKPSPRGRKPLLSRLSNTLNRITAWARAWQTYARVRGYSPWLRKDRSTQGGGVAFCYKDTVNVQVVNTFNLTLAAAAATPPPAFSSLQAPARQYACR